MVTSNNISKHQCHGLYGGIRLPVKLMNEIIDELENRGYTN